MTATGVGDPAAQRIALLSGAAAATAYMAAVIIGGLITPGYSQIQDDVSALIQRGAPQKAVLDPMFYAFNLLVIVYGVAVFRSVRWSLRRRRLGLVGSVALALGGLLASWSRYFRATRPEKWPRWPARCISFWSA
jgi:hypothetical protein